ncbi:hypothetical protein [Sphaerisporangium dianthi]|uniref:N-acetyltransferase n=1 Tax=Sphaerisporangium dianthi TaxID=1436120 RepID=A0ABV9CMX8_9ACTN
MPFMLFPHIQSPGVELQPVSAADGEKVYELLIQYGAGGLPTLEAFRRNNAGGAMAQFLVHGRAEERTVGVATLRDFNPAGHIKADIRVSTAHGPETTALVLNYAFAMWNLRKVYVHATEADHEAAGLADPLISPLLRREALLPRHVFARGRHWNLSVYSVYRDAWEKHAPDILDALVPTPDKEADDHA